MTAPTDTSASGPSGADHAERGRKYFSDEKYAEAAREFEMASAADPTNEDWRHMAAASSANAAAEVNVPVPDVHFFERDALLAAPEVSGLPPVLPYREPVSLLRRVRRALGTALGWVASAAMGGLTRLLGSDYRDDVWTNWYRRRLFRGVLSLAYMRERLNANNLRSTYPAGANVGFQPNGLQPPPGVTHFRTADGSWNNLADPKEGAAGTRFPRNVRNEAIRPARDRELLDPNPRRISLELLRRDGDMKEVPFLNLLAASWIQFQNHDWITHGENLSSEIIEIPLPDGDPAIDRYRQRNMFVGRTQPDPTHEAGEATPVTFVNEVTHWWDGSQIYGSDQATQERIRSCEHGKLRVETDGTLPLDRKGVEDSGMVRNWWVGLAMLHNLFVLEHNAICDMLMERHPDWDDSRLFNVARLINAAVMAKIHSVEWTPAILPNSRLDMALNANWYGTLTNLLKKGKDRKTVADINVRNPELGGIVGNPLDKHGSPYGLTEEFVEVYRLHSLLPEQLELRDPASGDEVDPVDFVASRQAGSPKVTERAGGMANLFYSFGNQHPGQLVLGNYPRFMQELSVPGNPVFDMGAIDILRARERGIPRYNEFRRQLGLNPIRTFEDLTSDPEVLAKLNDIYDGDVEKLDLLVGTLGEETRPTGFGFGETMFQIFILNASRRLQADRFYTDDYRPEVYTQEGLDWIDDVDLKTVILRHYPELEATGLGNVKNAFEPWDTGAKLDPARHPLREYDPTLKKDPWTGDAARG